MKKAIFYLSLCTIIGVSCGKDDDGGGNPPPGSSSYMDTSSGGVRNYAFKNNNPITPEENFTQTATNRDTLVAGKSYKVFTNSNGGNSYYNITPVTGGNDYYTQLTLNGLGTMIDPITNLYLKDYVNTGGSWANGPYTFNVDFGGTPVPLSVTLNNQVIASNTTRTVRGNNYTGVKHIKTTVSAVVGTPPISTPVTGLFSDINSYYAPRYGLIENSTILSIDFMGVQDSVNTQTFLLSATLP
ncbi:MAG TPA: hypothetical protein PLE75_06315 [Ferruginibacter sp.]|nr:hypothetical protein [Ferruginibacter sp.]HRO97685.1 hypothetical protein [Ferruginibacter sp.]